MKFSQENESIWALDSYGTVYNVEQGGSYFEAWCVTIQMKATEQHSRRMQFITLQGSSVFLMCLAFMSI